MLLAVHLSEAGLEGEMLEVADFNAPEVKLVGYVEEVKARAIIDGLGNAVGLSLYSVQRFVYTSY